MIGGQNNQLNGEATQLRKALAAIQTKQDNLTEAVATKALPLEGVRRSFDKLSSEAGVLQAKLLEIDGQLTHSQSRADQVRAAKEALEDFDLLWRTMSDSERRETLHIAIERIDVFVKDGRKWMEVKLATAEAPVEIEILRGGERYRPTVLDGVASLTPRELAALKHFLDGANYVQVSRYFDSGPSAPIHF